MRALVSGAVLLVSLAFLAPRIARADDSEVTCKDGTKSKGGSGACSGHGGIDKSAKSTSTGEPKSKSSKSSKSKSSEADEGTSKSKSSKSSKSKSSEADEGTSKSKSSKSSTSKSTEASASEVTCKDGTKSKGGSGACSGHGGIDKGAAKAAPEAKEASAPTSRGKSPDADQGESKSTSSKSTSSKSTGASASEVTCKDGTKSKGGSGACSGHGGIDRGESEGAPAAASAPAATSAPSKAPASSAPASGEKGKPTAKCKDGSLSYSQHHTGTCSDHGGVAQWLDGT